VRSTAFFDGAGATGPLAVLGAWVVLGLLATWVAGLGQRRPTPAVAPGGRLGGRPGAAPSPAQRGLRAGGYTDSP